MEGAERDEIKAKQYHQPRAAKRPICLLVGGAVVYVFQYVCISTITINVRQLKHHSNLRLLSVY